MKTCFQIAECSLSYAKIVKKIIPRKFLCLFFAPFSTFLRNDTPFYALNEKKIIQISLFPDFCLIFASKFGTKQSFLPII